MLNLSNYCVYAVIFRIVYISHTFKISDSMQLKIEYHPEQKQI